MLKGVSKLAGSSQRRKADITRKGKNYIKWGERGRQDQVLF